MPNLTRRALLKSSIAGVSIAGAAAMGVPSPASTLEVTATPVLADDASLMGTTIVVTDKTDIERIRHDQRMHQEISSELALGLRDSLTTISGYAQQLACSRDPDLAHQLADNIAHEAAQLDRTIGSFLGGSQAASAGS